MCLQLQITYNVMYMTKSGSKYIKAWLCLLYDAFELFEATGYKFNHIWTYHCILKVRHWIFISLIQLLVDKASTNSLHSWCIIT